MMKKIFLLSLLLVAFSTDGQAQFLKNLLGKVTNKVTEEVATTDAGSVVTNVLGTLIGNSVSVTKNVVQGTWSYDGTACVLESENALTEIGGTVATSKVEEKLDGYLSKLGVCKGSCTFTFQQNDSCYFTVNGRDVHGIYKLNEEEKTIDFSFLRGKLNMKSYISYNLTGMDVVFDADKMLALVKNATSVVSEKASSAGSLLSASSSSKLNSAATTIDAVSTLLSAYDGMMLGMRLTK